MMRIGIDAMGGDYAPKAVVEGAVLAQSKISADSTIVLYGKREDIEQYLPAQHSLEIVDCSEVIEMGDHPAEAFKKKPQSSIVQGFMHLAGGKIQGFASAGSTGAMMVGSMYVIKSIPGVIRPTIATHFVSTKGGLVTILDVGLNADCKPEVLAQYASMGSVYSREICGVENPRVALLNIGSEEGKGNLNAKATFPLLKEVEGINFFGNVEGKHIIDAEVADVIICDGYSGNILLKLLESLYDILKPDGVNLPYIDSMNYEVIGGTPVLGINSTVVIGHGASSPLAICNMVLATEKAVAKQLTEKYKQLAQSF